MEERALDDRPTGDRAMDDDRVSYDQVKGCWILEQEDGSVMEYDEKRRGWVPSLDTDDLKDYQTAYRRQGVDESEPVERKRKAPKEAGKGDKKKMVKRSSKDTSVYVTGLGPEATWQEVVDLFSRCGLIMEDPYTGEKKVKLYSNDDGKVKGDALVTYFKEDSVALAIQILDDTELKYGSGYRIKVVKADFSQKPAASAGPRPDPPKEKDVTEKKRAQKRIEKLESKLNDWDEEDETRPAVPLRAARSDRIVILKGIFSLQELEEDPALLLDLGQEIREECEKFGQVTSVTVYDLEPEGVVSVKFKEPVAAQACIVKMHQRWFGGRQLAAELYDPAQRYQKTDAAKLTGDGDQKGQEEKKRLDDFADWLEEAGGAREDNREEIGRTAPE